jgi:hypothetical protein
MALIISAPGADTVQITTTNSGGVYSTFTELAQAVADAVTGVAPVATTGWTVYDTFTSGIIYTQVFRALNKDGTTYKNAIFRWNTISCELNISTCELWDIINHIPQNEAWTYYDSSPIPYRLDATDLLLFINPRWLAAHSYMANEPTCWAGVFEMEREDVADTGGFPCWGWISSSLWMLGATSLGAVPIQGGGNTLISIPRTRAGATGFAASRTIACDYGVAQYPNVLSTTAAAFIYYIGNQVNKYVSNSWDTSKRLVMPLKPSFEFTSSYVSNYGQIYGLKVISPAGNNMNKIQVNVNSDGNYSPSGTLTDHWILNNHYKPCQNQTSAWFTNTNLVMSAYPVGFRPQYFTSTGSSYYITAGDQGNNLTKVNILTGVYVNIKTDRQYYDVKYDGERYVYASSSAGLTRIDTRDDTTTDLSVGAGGIYAFDINATHLVCAQYTSSATPIIWRVLRTTFAVDSSNGSITLATFNESVRISCITMDMAGNAHLVAPVATAANFKVCKILAATPASPIYQLNNFSVSTNAGIMMINEYTMLVITHLTSGATYMYTYHPLTLALVSTNLTVGTNPAMTVNFYKPSMIKISGTIMSMGRSNTTTAYGYMTNLGTNSATTTWTPITPIQTGDMYSTTGNISGVSSMAAMYWDGARMVGIYDSGLRVFSGINGNNVQSSVAVGQTLLPI